MLTTRYILDEAHLKHYDDRLKSWASSQPVKTLPSSLYPWTQDKAGAVTCWPVGGTELKPIVDFLFTEVPPASGDKGPDNPSTISGVSEVKVGRCGRNLLFLRDVTPVTKNGVTYSVDSNGIITLNGTATSVSSLAYVTDKILVTTNTSLVGTNEIVSGSFSKASGQSAAFKVQLAIKLADGTVSNPGKLDEGSQVFSINQEGYIYSGAIVVYQGATFSNCKIKSQIEIGAVATSWESPANDIFTFPLGSTYYGGTLDVATGVMTVTHGKYVFTGNEQGWSSDGNGGLHSYNVSTGLGFTQLNLNNYIGAEAENGNSECTHLIYTATSEAQVQDGRRTFACYCLVGDGKQLRFIVPFSTISDLQAWLSAQNANGTPVAVTYKLANPYTVQLDPQQILSLTQTDKYTPRLNTVYTDASAVQVGYVKSPIREEQELTQAIVAQGGEI